MTETFSIRPARLNLQPLPPAFCRNHSPPAGCPQTPLFSIKFTRPKRTGRTRASEAATRRLSSPHAAPFRVFCVVCGQPLFPQRTSNLDSACPNSDSLRPTIHSGCEEPSCRPISAFYFLLSAFPFQLSPRRRHRIKPAHPHCDCSSGSEAVTTASTWAPTISAFYFLLSAFPFQVSSLIPRLSLPSGHEFPQGFPQRQQVRRPLEHHVYRRGVFRRLPAVQHHPGFG